MKFKVHIHSAPGLEALALYHCSPTRGQVVVRHTFDLAQAFDSEGFQRGPQPFES